MMKPYKLLFSIAVACGAMTLTSCNDFLKEDPKHLVSPDQLGDTEEACDQWVAGVYSKWLNDMFRWSNFPRVLELDADYISGPDWLFSSLGAGSFQADPGTMNTMWNGPYAIISRANLAEKYISRLNIDEDYKNNALGEVYFNKAFAYFLLVRAFGPVPIRNKTIQDGDEPDSPRRPVAEVYEEIINLLTKAAGLMYTHEDPNFRRGHVCAGTAAGMLAKVYATMASAAMPEGTQLYVRTGPPYEIVNGDSYYTGLTTMTFSKSKVDGYENMNAKELYTKAAEWAWKVINGEYGSYDLLPYDELWTKSHSNDPEFMFSIQAIAGNEVYRNQIHSYYSGYTVSSSSEVIGGGQWIGCTDHWYKLFDPQDLRIVKGVKHRFIYTYNEKDNQGMYYPKNAEWTLKATGYDENGNKVADPVAPFDDGRQYYYNQSSECLAFTTKYDDVTDSSSDYADAQWPFLRFADVLLIYAEAEAELDHSDIAIKYLNKVRRRSNAVESNDPGDLVKLRSMILEERAKEFACEGDRRWDLLRWGIYLQAMNAIGGRDDANNNKNRTSRNLLYPIPQDEINSNDSITSNNPGWN